MLCAIGWTAILLARPCVAEAASDSEGVLASKQDEPSSNVDPLANTSPSTLQALRAGGWLVLMLGSGTIWYVLDKRNVLDWDHPSLKSRFTGSAWRFDNNGFGMNFFLHPLSGAGGYAFPRANGFSVYQSALASFTTSMVWEYVIEYNERVSINDVMVTPAAGISIGEFAHKLGFYLNSASHNGWGRHLARWTLSPIVSLHRELDGTRSDHGNRDSLGYSTDIWHSFDVGFATSTVKPRGDASLTRRDWSASGRLVSLPRYGRPGAMSTWFSHADFSDLSLDVDTSARGSGITLESAATIAGHHWQNMSPDRSGLMQTAGVALGYFYRNTRASGYDDRISWVGFPGASYDLYVRSGGLGSALQVRVFPGFGGLNAAAFPVYLEQHPDTKTKTILEREGYYYGWGLVAEVRGEMALGPILLRGTLVAGSYSSQEGLDRTQEEVVDDVGASDRWLEVEGQAMLRIPGAPLGAGITVQDNVRESSVGNVRQTYGHRAVGACLDVAF